MTDQSDEKIFQNMSSVRNWILHSSVVELSILSFHLILETTLNQGPLK